MNVPPVSTPTRYFTEFTCVVLMGVMGVRDMMDMKTSAFLLNPRPLDFDVCLSLDQLDDACEVTITQLGGGLLPYLVDG